MYVYQLRFENTYNGIKFYTNGLTFRRRQDAERHKKLHYKNSARSVQIVRIHPLTNPQHN